MYLTNLGTFIGLLTVAANRPLYAKEIDLKQMLIEGFASDKMRLVVTFVCRIMRECKQSMIFKVQNPWVKANLEILKEISEKCGQPTQSNPRTDVILEIESLFKHFGLNIADQQHQGFLNALQTQNYSSLSQ
jgi:CCR4-NOT transcription complex subunit 1